MKRILVTGAGGFIGRHTCRYLIARGYEVRGVIRSTLQPQAAVPGVEYTRIGDIGPETSWHGNLANVDAVIHLAAHVHALKSSREDATTFHRVNALGSVRLAAQAAEAGVARLLFMSSIKVNGDSTSVRPFRADDRADPQDEYAKSKLEAELRLGELCASRNLALIIIRPPLVYGSGVGANFRRLVRLVEYGIPLPFGAIENRRSLVSVWNLSSLIERALGHPATPGRVWLVSDGEDLSTPDLLRRMARAMSRPVRLVRFPPHWVDVAARIVGRREEIARLLGSLQVDSAPTCRELGWTPPLSVDQGLAETVGAFRARR